MHLIMTGQNTVKKIAPKKLTPDLRKATAAAAVNRSRPESNYPVCSSCGATVFNLDASHCLTCERKIAARFAEAEFQAETRRMMKILGLSGMFVSIVIGILFYLNTQ